MIRKAMKQRFDTVQNKINSAAEAVEKYSPTQARAPAGTERGGQWTSGGGGGSSKTGVQVGNIVGYSRAWLQSTGMLTGPIPFARGVVMDLEDFGRSSLATVQWDIEDAPSKVLAVNLARVGTGQTAI